MTRYVHPLRRIGHTTPSQDAIQPESSGEPLTPGPPPARNGTAASHTPAAREGPQLAPVLILALGTALSLGSAAFAQCLFMRGDANGDGAVTADDAELIIQITLGNRPALFDCDDALDANDDGEADYSDALPVLAWVYQEGPRLPEPFLTCGRDRGTSAGCNEPSPACASQETGAFLRGDANADGAVDLSDAVFIARYLLRDPFALYLECHGPADTDDDGRVELDDVLALLNYLFRPGPPIPPPFPDCGPDPTGNAGCCDHAPCR